MTDESENRFRRVISLLISPFGIGADWIATSIFIVLILFFQRSTISAFTEIRRFFGRWLQFYRTGVWEWDLGERR